jgi:monoterpene epsilon-lactone hydrolase
MASQELQTVIQMLGAADLGPDTSIEDMRAALEAMSAVTPAPEGTQSTPVSANGVPCEWISGPGARDDRGLLYLHGGGYVIGSINSHRGTVSRLSSATGARALAVDYRLGPEHPFPAAVDDAVAAYRFLLDSGVESSRVVIAGDSAGGGLTVATLLVLRDAGDPLPAAGVCISPWVDLEGNGESMTTKADVDPMVQRDGLLRMAQAYLGGADARAPLASPLYADLAGLPPLLIHVGTSETLLDDATRLAERAKAAGVDVELECWDEMIHVWHAFAPLLPEANQAIERIGEYVAKRVS